MSAGGSRWTRLCGVNEVDESTVKRVDLDRHGSIAVYRLDGEFFATDNVCTHADAFLSEGLVDGGLIECPFHGGTFRIQTGEAVDLPCRVPLRTYALEISDGSVFVDLTPKAPGEG